MYLRGISTGDFQEALAALLGKDAPNLGCVNEPWPTLLTMLAPLLERVIAHTELRLPARVRRKRYDLGAGLEDVRPVGQTVDQRLAEPGVGEDLSPLGERQVAGHDHRRALGRSAKLITSAW